MCKGAGSRGKSYVIVRGCRLQPSGVWTPPRCNFRLQSVCRKFFKMPEDQAGKLTQYAFLFLVFFTGPVSRVSYTASLSCHAWFYILLCLTRGSVSSKLHLAGFCGGTERGKTLGQNPPWSGQRWGGTALWTQMSASKLLLPLPCTPKQP